MNRHNLEETIKGRVALLLEETMEKSWGIYVPQVQSDLTDKLQHQLPLKFYVPTASSFQEAKRKFKSEFLKNQLHLHNGNISQLAKFIGIDRRSVHRAIRGLDLQLDEVRREHNAGSPQEKIINQTIRFTLEGYKDIIQPQKMEKMYQELPNLTKSIARYLPLEELTWKEAEREFERQFLVQALRERQGNVPKTAQELKIRPETLYRKIKKLEIKV